MTLDKSLDLYAFLVFLYRKMVYRDISPMHPVDVTIHPMSYPPEILTRCDQGKFSEINFPSVTVVHFMLI